ncbi:hypothetical protein GA0115252_10891 [Streptomyces sp. DfronAA-171]|nr:hypothetical protein GA0115252_10891 [Streptomyces sp. DfronAA-171]
MQMTTRIKMWQSSDAAILFSMSDSSVPNVSTVPRNPTGSRLLPLKGDLHPAKRALAEALRALFAGLDVSVRRYAARQHLDASTVTRYLNGERVPDWSFIAELAEEIAQVSTPLTTDVLEALRASRQSALQTQRRGGALQDLQGQLAEADEETRRIRLSERALEQALAERERALSHSLSRCQYLRTKIGKERTAHTAELLVWHGEWQQIFEECRDLRLDVKQLEEALALTRAELIAAEGECHRLEVELEAMFPRNSDSLGALPLLDALEAADRTSSVAELLAVVGDLEARTQKAMARELVTSASRSREVTDVAALLAGLHEAGFTAHAEAALAALVMTRPAGEIAALTVELHHAALGDFVAVLLSSSVKLHTPCDIIGVAVQLSDSGCGEVVHALLSAAFVSRTVADAVALAIWAASTQVESATLTAMGPTGARRDLNEVVELALALRHAGRVDHTHALLTAVAEQRSAKEIIATLEYLAAKGLLAEAEEVFAVTQSRDVVHVLSLIRSLIEEGVTDRAVAVVNRAARDRSIGDVANMISHLYSTSHFPQADQALMSFLRAVPDKAPFLFRLLDDMYPGAEETVRMTAASGDPEKAAALFHLLESADLPVLAEGVFHETLTQRPTGHAGRFLQVLVGAEAVVCQRQALLERARSAPGTEVARLLLALAGADLLEEAAFVVRGVVEAYSPAEVMLLIKQLRSVDHPTRPKADGVLQLLLGVLVGTWQVDDQVALVMTLSEADMGADAKRLIRVASSLSQFKPALRAEETKHAQKVFSRAFWKSFSAEAG